MSTDGSHAPLIALPEDIDGSQREAAELGERSAAIVPDLLRNDRGYAPRTTRERQVSMGERSQGECKDKTSTEERVQWLVRRPARTKGGFSRGLLLIHGEADDNSGTFPIQSERLYQAVRGNGGTVRLVFLPAEAHAYRAKETIEHVNWEKLRWFDMYVKGEIPAVSSAKAGR